MANQSENTIKQSIQRQESILYQDIITKEPNRQGLRKETGKLLEDAFLDLIFHLQPSLSLEIGAHEASYSKAVKQLLPNTKIIAFEANPFVYQQYVNKLPQGIDYKNLAIADTEEEIELQIPISLNGESINRTNPISSVLSRRHDGFDYQPVRVPCTTLDLATASLDSSCSVAWIDVEGAQSQLIAGGQHFLQQVRAIFIELEHQQVWEGQEVATNIIAMLADYGLQMLMRDNLADGQYNAVFIRETEETTKQTSATAANYLESLTSLVDHKDKKNSKP